ncbi:hypothetical protein PCE1_003535 [Barthelona sp. PCE]
MEEEFFGLHQFSEYDPDDVISEEIDFASLSLEEGLFFNIYFALCNHCDVTPAPCIIKSFHCICNLQNTEYRKCKRADPVQFEIDSQTSTIEAVKLQITSNITESNWKLINIALPLSTDIKGVNFYGDLPEEHHLEEIFKHNYTFFGFENVADLNPVINYLRTFLTEFDNGDTYLRQLFVSNCHGEEIKELFEILSLSRISELLMVDCSLHAATDALYTFLDSRSITLRKLGFVNCDLSPEDLANLVEYLDEHEASETELERYGPWSADFEAMYAKKKKKNVSFKKQYFGENEFNARAISSLNEVPFFPLEVLDLSFMPIGDLQTKLMFYAEKSECSIITEGCSLTLDTKEALLESRSTSRLAKNEEQNE